ncbi:MAG: hypothetical protein QXK76_01735 [Candidatus Woesearchaeota archaeon]
MILIIDICKEELHYNEFVKPIEEIMKAENQKYLIVKGNSIITCPGYADKIIIAGTSLRDFDYEKQDFSWIRAYNKPILGICAGMQIICKEYKCSLGKATEIGLKEIKFDKEFLSVKGKIQAYCLHNIIIKNSKNLRTLFDIYARNQYIQAIKHKQKPIYATLFHPEVRNKDIIVQFIRQ